MADDVALSALVLLIRTDGPKPRIFWARRHEHLKFLGGFHAFPGGGVEETDASIPATGDPVAGIDASLYGCALRELFEELGVLITDAGATSILDNPDLAGLREAAADDAIDFAAAMAERGLRLDVARLHGVGRWTTPEWSALRFETEFFVATLTDEEVGAIGADDLTAHVQDSELTDAEWLTLDDALAMHLRAEAFLSAPTIALIRHMRREALAGRLTRPTRIDQADLDNPLTHHEYIGGTYMIPVESPTIPPATHTNCSVVGTKEFVVIDPGSQDVEEMQQVIDVIDALTDAGGIFKAIVITHHHVDHICGVPLLRERYPEVPVWGHEANEGLMEPHIDALDRHLTDNEVITLGEDHSLRCLWTPGHAPGHLALEHEPTRTIFVGDLIASKGTILIRPPDGHMGDYMSSLLRIRGRDRARGLHPAHGWTVADATGKLQEYITHREEREEQVLDALRAATRDGSWARPMDLVPAVYTDVPEEVWALAAMSLSAHLIHLEEMGTAERQGETMAFRVAQ